jgi:ferritin
MISDKVVKTISEQINMEYASAYIYLDMSTAMDHQGFKGYAKWLFIQYKEELKHAEKFIDFLQRRGTEPVLTDIAAPKLTAKAPLEIAKAAYAHEMKVSASIDKIYDLAVKEGDHASASFLKWYIDEQVEEEENTRNIVDMFTIAGSDTLSKFEIDKLLGKRDG